MLKVISWNVNGLRAVVKKGFVNSLKQLNPDVMCLQEIKSDDKTIPEDVIDFCKGNNYELIINPAMRKGYAGTAVMTKVKPKTIITQIGVEQFDDEGRFIFIEYDKFYLFNTYFPHSRHDLSRLEFKMKFNDAYIHFVNKQFKHKNKPMLLTGDFNVAHNEIDLANPKQNETNAGYTVEERRFIDRLLSEGFVDTFRYFHPTTVKYSWWSFRFHARQRNIGWRVDYFFIDKNHLGVINDSDILTDITGSDHAPIILYLTF
ncbi:exodeoxyribonuclease III [Candidatus Micrarchaeota archaeon]|nr:exodeoxyribonuclease III [Candidatus Micrarchaeota archaeon]